MLQIEEAINETIKSKKCMVGLKHNAKMVGFFLAESRKFTHEKFRPIMDICGPHDTLPVYPLDQV